MTMNMDPVATWQSSDIFLLFVMWAIMMAGMMLPSAIPVIMLIDKINQQQLSNQQSYTPTLFFVLGYIIAWSLYSLLVTFLQYWFHHLALLTPMMDSANAYFSAAILIIAGVYQFTPWKQQCLKFCRSPLAVISKGWKQGLRGGLNLGFTHGSYCVGCCWFLMAILFVTGVMNLQWILILTLLVLIEKIAPKGEQFSKFIGVLLTGYGISFLV
ncbi:DUF2182 domain-containing protein [Thalassotalea litorea]|uniref:DUF2182 domain-containing protein n=2 Tax=Thalassotalea litorea TaxID=2020715 RepID=A0A5R9IPE4_9GAMM|nr:DUF2182 domain-containing protein [Thalassotalea litorea]